MDNNLGNKEIMARNIQRLMDLYDKDRTEVCKDLGISYTTFTDWVKGKTYPRIDKIELLANYFHVSKADLVEEYNAGNYEKDDIFVIVQKAIDNPLILELIHTASGCSDADIKQANEMLKRLKAYSDKLKEFDNVRPETRG